MNPNDRRNRTQRECTGPTDEPEFIVGEIYGLRQWTLSHETSRLFGHYGHPWDLYGVNTAACKRKVEAVSARVPVDGKEHYTEGDVDDLFERITYSLQEFPKARNVSITVNSAPVTEGTIYISDDVAHGRAAPGPEDIHLLRSLLVFAVHSLELTLSVRAVNPLAPHPIAHPECTCGFYAYTSKAALYRNSTASMNNVFGLVRAHGHITQGTAGLRAERAEIVALTRPLHGQYVTTRTSIYGVVDKFYPWNLTNPRPHAKDWTRSPHKEIHRIFDALDTSHLSVVDDLDALLSLANFYIDLD